MVDIEEVAEMPATPWYKDGLRFQCTGCGDCCTGGPGYVWVNQAEIDAGDREGLTTEEKEELRRLRREVKVLREEREILKKTINIFSRKSE